MTTIDETVAGEMMNSMLEVAEKYGIIWIVYKIENVWHIEMNRPEKKMPNISFQGDTFRAAWNNLIKFCEANPAAQELTRRRQIN